MCLWKDDDTSSVRGSFTVVDGFGGSGGGVFSSNYIPIITLAGTAFHSSQNVINDDVTRIIPGIKTVVK